MKCNLCGKTVVVANVVCSDCMSHLMSGYKQTRLGYFVQHPDQMVEELLHDTPWCRNLAECIAASNRDEMIDEEKCKKCCMDWLMEKVEDA